MTSSKGIVLCLCDLTGIFAAPWVENGYSAVLVDPQHTHTHTHTQSAVTKLAATIEQGFGPIGELLRSGDVVFVAGFPPCTDMAVSGGRWFAEKYKKDKMFQAKAVSVAEQCRVIGEMSGAPYFVENPVSVLSNVFGPAHYTFHPCDYTGFEPDDNYTKRTCLWVGNGFKMPPQNKDMTLGAPDQRIWKMGGADRANKRSMTPRGFARAVYEANH